jgi:hypothetical protein
MQVAPTAKLRAMTYGSHIKIFGILEVVQSVAASILGMGVL